MKITYLVTASRDVTIETESGNNSDNFKKIEDAINSNGEEWFIDNILTEKAEDDDKICVRRNNITK